jgi:hypothetical protein
MSWFGGVTNESGLHCVETKHEEPGTLRGSFNWYAFREKGDRVMRKKLKGLELVPNGMERCTGRTAPTRPLD